jgi:pimeloyl-ACP methyl ester carboxylesterase
MRGPGATAELTADPAILAEREASFDDIVPGAEARVVWAGAPGEVTRWAVLYLHGFSASSEEIRPVPDLVAEALGANLVFNRLPGHGRTAEAMGEATATEWIDDTDLMLDIARDRGRPGAGDRDLHRRHAGRLCRDRGRHGGRCGRDRLRLAELRAGRADGRVLQWPFAGLIAQTLLGPERGFEPINEAQATYWTEWHPTMAVVRMGAIMREVRLRDLSQARMPALFVFSDDDQVVSPPATRRVAERWGGPAQLAPQTLPSEGVDPSAHVIAGDIVSPAMTDAVTAQILDWVGQLQD